MARLIALLALLAALPGVASAGPISGVRQLTFEGKRAGEGYFSADGRRMIFQSERAEGNPFYQMYLMDLETGDIQRLSPGQGKTTCGWLHPDGKRALFASTQLDPEARKKMKAELDFRASGQSRRYSWDYDETYEIFEVDIETGDYTTLTNALGYDAEGAYSPDGTQIVFASNRHAYAEALSDEDAARLQRDFSYFMEIYVMDADGSNLRRLTDAPGYDGGPFWSADGKQITWRRFSEDGARAEIYTMNADGTGEQRITDLGVLSWAPFFHPSGDYLIFSTNLQGFANFELYLVDAAGERAPVRVTDREGFDGLATFSPDGKTISWTSNATPGKKSQIFLASWDHEAALSLLDQAPPRQEAAAPAPALEEASADIAVEDLRRIVAALTSDEMGGRLTGTEGEKRATAYVAEAFSALGLKPAGDEGSMFQSFEFTAGVALAEGNAFEVSVDGKAESLALDEQWRPLAFARTGKVEQASVLFAGYGLVAPAEGDTPAFDSYGELDASGKWVLIWRGMPGELSNERRTKLSRFADLRYKASVAKSRGAAGVVFAPPPRESFEDGLPRLAYEATSGVAGLPVVAVDRATSARMLAILGDDLAPMTAAIEAGESAGRDLIGVAVSGALALDFEKHSGRNVLARLELDGLAEGGRPPLVIGAHVDHIGRGETSGSLARGDERGKIHPGADDNASGVAALIEVAQKLTADHASGRLKGKRDVIFAAWSGEELGLLGSSHFADMTAEKAGAEDLAGLVSAYINMDMVGRLDDRVIVLGLGSSDIWAREVERRNAVVGLPIVTSNDTYLPTDATAFYLKGVPILSVFTGAHEDYNRPSDTAEKLNYEGMRDIARFVALVARSRIMADEEPAYVEVARPEGRGGRQMSNIFLGTIPDYASEGQKGVPISGVVKDGPAEKAGLAGGDVVVGLAGQELENIYDYIRTLNGLKPGETVEITVLRKGARQTFSIEPGLRN
ncbi:MAG: M20/M25/M40 family metallo-hydrolase [Kiloniellales bacterium]|nr:M20/M25/M40 family metallo-hydrolase [Kiloniellales bacterium]